MYREFAYVGLFVSSVVYTNVKHGYYSLFCINWRVDPWTLYKTAVKCALYMITGYSDSQF